MSREWVGRWDVGGEIYLRTNLLCALPGWPSMPASTVRAPRGGRRAGARAPSGSHQGSQTALSVCLGCSLPIPGVPATLVVVLLQGTGPGHRCHLCAEEGEAGQGAGGLPTHLGAGDQHPALPGSPQHCQRQRGARGGREPEVLKPVWCWGGGASPAPSVREVRTSLTGAVSALPVEVGG